MFSYSSQGQESSGYFQKRKELPIQLYVIIKAEGQKTKKQKAVFSICSETPDPGALRSETGFSHAALS